MPCAETPLAWPRRLNFLCMHEHQRLQLLSVFHLWYSYDLTAQDHCRLLPVPLAQAACENTEEQIRARQQHKYLAAKCRARTFFFSGPLPCSALTLGSKPTDFLGDSLTAALFVSLGAPEDA